MTLCVSLNSGRIAITFPTVDLTLSLLTEAGNVDTATLLAAMADIMDVEQSRLGLLSVSNIVEGNCEATVRVVRTAAPEKLASYEGAQNFIDSWHDGTVMTGTFPYDVDPNTPPSYVILDTSEKKEKEDNNDTPWWKQRNIQVGVGAVVALVIVGAVVGFFIKRRRQRRQNAVVTTRDSTIYTYQSAPSFVRSNSNRKPGFQDSGL